MYPAAHMSPPPKPATRFQVVIYAAIMLALAAWFFHDAMYVIHTGHPLPVRGYSGDASEYILYGAAALVVGIALLGVAAGIIKSLQDPP